MASAIFDAFFIRSKQGRRLSAINYLIDGVRIDGHISPKAKVNPPFQMYGSYVGDFTYIAPGSQLNMITIGKFCSIGPNLFAGYGIHPLNGISTSPMFYSTLRQNGSSLSDTNKIKERASITVGNDVFIGANVTILDGVTIGDGAVIGAGAIVSKSIPDYAIAVGSPIRIVRYRFDEPTIQKFQKIKWWDWPEERLLEVEKDFFNVEEFVKRHD
ncbi:MAG: CatB-related O-acetyltransferase [Bacteroidota bacterium]